MELGVKLLPDKASVNDGPPAVVLAGLSAPTTGCRFAAAIVKGTALDVALPLVPLAGFVTLIDTVPGLAMSLVETAMLS
jgi:hypothetical protein